ncbi:hypothetical protein KC19_2G220900 [Ceratodon purpureus]|uniref:Uncharacterized protein n=1 Tax=Ceratodon purpureus TaxID=3225 RepID=A0A8T0IZ36_CERPU|nr:hypothetical protein KC19_2G220900 [Ceratodon purpureus]
MAPNSTPILQPLQENTPNSAKPARSQTLPRNSKNPTRRSGNPTSPIRRHLFTPMKFPSSPKNNETHHNPTKPNKIQRNPTKPATRLKNLLPPKTPNPPNVAPKSAPSDNVRYQRPLPLRTLFL